MTQDVDSSVVPMSFAIADIVSSTVVVRMSISTCKLSRVFWDTLNDNDNDNDTLEEVPHSSNEGLALQARVSGPWPHKKESVLLVELARWQGVQTQNRTKILLRNTEKCSKRESPREQLRSYQLGKIASSGGSVCEHRRTHWRESPTRDGHD